MQSVNKLGEALRNNAKLNLTNGETLNQNAITNLIDKLNNFRRDPIRSLFHSFLQINNNTHKLELRGF